jgi:protein-tyrosine kinase
VGRIDEALRRSGSAGPEPSHGGDSVFRSAWPVSDGFTRPEGFTREEAASVKTAVLPAEIAIATAQPQTPVRGFASEWRERLASGPQANPLLLEQFRRLAATLYHAQATNGLRSIMVTSASPSDGKTMTAVNLALVLSESYRRRVLLIDADLRRPSIPNVTDLTDAVGLSETLRAQTEQKLALVPVTPTLTLLPAGQPIADPISALTSPRMRRILDEAAARFDWVILDAPPIGPVADASLLAEMVDGTLFVLRAGRTQYPAVKKAIDSLGRDRLLGVVLNGADQSLAITYEPYYGDGLAATS